MTLRSWLCCWDNPLGSINFTLITFYNTRALASFLQTTVWAVRVTNCETAAIWPMRIMQQMWPTGSGQYMENTSGNSQEALGILHWIPVSLQRGLFKKWLHNISSTTFSSYRHTITAAPRSIQAFSTTILMTQNHKLLVSCNPNKQHTSTPPPIRDHLLTANSLSQSSALPIQKPQTLNLKGEIQIMLPLKQK